MSVLRREFLGALAGAGLAGRDLEARESRCDVAVIGGGTGGCAAALAAARNGLRVIMSEETAWIGGQITAQLVPPDEHPGSSSLEGLRPTARIAKRCAITTGGITRSRPPRARDAI